MRAYSRNSPQAAARLVALAMLADGYVSKREIDTLDRMDAYGVLGLPRAELNEVLQVLCEELLISAHQSWADVCRIDEGMLASFMSEIDDPDLRLKVLQLCVSVVAADSHVADNESIVLGSLIDHWNMHREMRELASVDVIT